MAGPGRIGRLAGWVALALVALVGVTGVVLHLPPARAAVLNWASARVADAAGIRLVAARLDYNLLTLSAGLTDLTVASTSSPGVPFFEAGRVDVTLDGAVLGGDLRFVEIAVADGRVVVVQSADGTSNLPDGAGGGGAPPAIVVDRLALDRLAVTVDTPSLSLDLPRLDAELTPMSGALAFGAPATLDIAGSRVVVSDVDGGASFDGRAVRVRDLVVTTDEVTAILDGRVDLLVEEPALALDVQATGDLGRLAAWGGLVGGDAPAGTVTALAEIGGPLTAPAVTLTASVPRLAWRTAAVDDVRAEAEVDATGLDIQSLTFTAAGGAVTASGGVGFGTLARIDAEAGWQDVDVAALLAQLVPDVELPLAGRLAGTAQLSGPLEDVETWDGAVTLDVVARAGAGLTLPGTARVTLADGVWQVSAAHRVAGLVPVEVEVVGTLTPDDWAGGSLRGAIDVPGTTIDAVAGALAASGAIASPDLGGLRGGAVLTVRVDGTVGEPAIEADAVLTGIEGPQFSTDRVVLAATGTPSAEGPVAFTLSSDRVVAAGQALVDLEVGGRFADGVLTLDRARVDQPGAAGRLELAGTYRIEGGSYDIAGTLVDWTLLPSETLPASGTLEAQVSGTGTLAAPAGQVAIALSGGRWEALELGTIEAVVDAAGGTAVVTAAAPAFGVSATGRVATAAPWGAVVDLQAEDADLARVLADLGLPVAVAGVVGLTAHAEGPLEDWQSVEVAVVVSRLDARINEAVVSLASPAELRYAGGRVEVVSLAARVGDVPVMLEGTLALESALAAPDAAPLVLSANGATADLINLAQALGATDLPAVEADGPVRVDLRVAGSATAPVMTGDVTIGPGPVRFGELPPLTAVQLRAQLADGRVTLVEAGGTYQGARVSATGAAPLALFGIDAPGATPGPASLSLQVTGVTSRVLQSVLDPDVLARMAGVADLTVELTAPSLDAADVSGELRLDRFLVAVSGVPIQQQAPTRLVAENGLVRVVTWDWTGGGAGLSVSGTADLAARRLDLATDGTLDLRLLTPFLRDAGIAPSGQLRPQLTIAGTFEAPDVAGEITLEGGELQVADPRVLVSDLTLRAVLERPRLELVALSGQVNGGALTGGGAISLDPGAGSTGSLQLMVDGMALELPDGLRSEVDADLDLRLTGGTGDTPLGGAIEGRVVVVRGAYREQLSAIGTLLGALNAERVVVVDQAPALTSRVTLDIALLTEEDLVVDNNYAELLLGADLRVLGTAASPALSGRAEIREGGRLFVGPNTFNITQGTIDFANPVQIEPIFGIVATTRAGGEDIEVTISGPPGDLTIDPVSTSRPELSRTDVQALLLTGRTLDQLSSADAAALGAQLAGSFSGDVLGVAGRAVGLDTLRLDAAAPAEAGGGVGVATVASLGPAADTTFRLPGDSATLATEADPTSRLTFGRALAPNLDLIFSQSLAISDAQTWILDYQPFRRVDLRFVSNDESLRAYSLRHDVTFGERTTAGGTTPRVEPRVVAVRVEGELALPEAEVRSVLGLGPGDRFGFPDWLDDRDALEALYAERGYLTAEIDATRVASDGDVTLTYSIVAGPPTVVRVTGRVLDDDVLDAIEAAWADTVSEDFLVEEVSTLVRAALARDGDFGATVGATLADEADTRVLTVRVQGGGDAGRLVPRVTGADPVLAGAIASRLEALPLSELSVTDPGGLADAVAAYMRTRGHLRAAASVDPVVVSDGAAVLPVRVQPGPVFVVGAVRFDGIDPLTEEAVRPVVALEPGDLHDTARTAQVRDRVAALYRTEGFPRAAVVAREDVREEEGVVDVAFVVTPGPRQELREIVVRGNEQVADGTVLDALGLSPGTPLRADEWLAARIRLFETELFRRVDLTTELIEEQDAGADVEPVRAVVEVEEWPALRLRYGFEVAEERPEENVDGRDLVPGVRADLIRRTLFGRAINVGTALQLQRREQTSRVFLRTPTLLGLPLESQVVLRGVREEILNDTFRRYVAGITLEQRYRISPDVLISYSYDFEQNRTFDTEPDFGEIPFDVKVNLAKLRANASWDTRNDPSNASRGHLLTTSIEFTPESLGSSISYVRSLTQAYWFRPWRQVVLASAGRVGVIGALGDEPLGRFNRFFAGGARSVRGVVENGLGERDFFGDLTGGEVLLILNQEVRFPIYRWLRGVAFVDAGNVFLTRSDFSLAGLTGAGGFGLRLDTPFGLFRVDVGKQIWNAGEDAGAQITFGIGQAF